jgi:two-component system chemotaxis sensor kinase CheA
LENYQLLNGPTNSADEAIFLSGLSTADQASDISGRGVGMSAIEAAVKDADGILDVDSHRGKGTVVTISVPKERRVFKASKVA